MKLLDPYFIRLLYAFLAATVWAVLPATKPANQPPRICIPCDIKAIPDGDTIRCDVLMPWGVTLRDQEVRLTGYDAYEASRRRKSVVVTDAEVLKGIVAANAFRGLVEGGILYLTPGLQERDNYGRILARPLLYSRAGEVVDVPAWMEANGYVRKSNKEIQEMYK